MIFVVFINIIVKDNNDTITHKQIIFVDLKISVDLSSPTLECRTLECRTLEIASLKVNIFVSLFRIIYIYLKLSGPADQYGRCTYAIEYHVFRGGFIFLFRVKDHEGRYCLDRIYFDGVFCHNKLSNKWEIVYCMKKRFMPVPARVLCTKYCRFQSF